jgi:hypothetical protein
MDASVSAGEPETPAADKDAVVRADAELAPASARSVDARMPLPRLGPALLSGRTRIVARRWRLQ